MELPLTIVAIAIVVLAVTALANRIKFSAPLLVMVAGIGASFVPMISVPVLSPEVVLLGFLPPLLYSAAIRTSVIDFRANRAVIGRLSVLLVVLTALGVGLIAWLLLPISFAVAFTLGAVVAPPDAVAATSIARRVGMPRRLVTILEGESLVNDATAITCLRIGLAAIGGSVSVAGVAGGFLITALGGAAVGLLVALIVVPIRRRITEPAFDTAVSLILPFAAYLPAEQIYLGGFHGSGVIAVVTTGLILGHKAPVIQTAQSRVSDRVNWATIQLLLENTVFLLIGLQARSILDGISSSELSGGRIAVFCAAVFVGVIVIRLVAVLSSRALDSRRTSARRRRRSGVSVELAPWSHSLVVAWAGLRGVVTLAAALIIPADVPQRDLLVFAAMIVTAGTLLLQGLTLPALVRALNITGPDPRSDALQAATVIQTASNVALSTLDDPSLDVTPATVEEVRSRLASRTDALWEKLGNTATETPAEQYRRLRLVTLGVERREVLRIRSEATVDHEVIGQVLSSLDVEESMLTIATQRSDELSTNAPMMTPVGPNVACQHLLAAPTDHPPALSSGCARCERDGTDPVHLRICLTCGEVGCCDSSVGRHAEAHFTQTRHPVMRSFEPGESWQWCYLDESLN